MFLRKETAGAAPGFTWHTAGEVVEVPDWLGEELLAIRAGGFTEVEAPAPEPEPEPAAEPELTRGQKAAMTRAANKAAAGSAGEPESPEEPSGEVSTPAGAEKPSEASVAPADAKE